ncbi:unnamed protein product [Prunus armeniaca]
MVDTRRTKSNTATTGPYHGFVVETLLQPQGTMVANTLQPPPNAVQPPPTAGVVEQPLQTVPGIAEQPFPATADSC